MTTDTAIRMRGIEKSFDEQHVLRGVDLDVEPGSVFALLGSNGAGKTTLVKILATLLKSDAGTATVDVHLAYNNVLHRLAAFGASNVVLLALWAVLAARLV